MQDFQKKLEKAYAAEQALAAEVKELIVEIVNSVSDSKLSGVKYQKDNPICATVSLSTVMSNGGLNLSQTYYISEYQASAIREKLSNMHSLRQVFSFIDECVENQHMIWRGEKIMFNSAVIETLKKIQKYL